MRNTILTTALIFGLAGHTFATEKEAVELDATETALATEYVAEPNDQGEFSSCYFDGRHSRIVKIYNQNGDYVTGRLSSEGRWTLDSYGDPVLEVYFDLSSGSVIHRGYARSMPEECLGNPSVTTRNGSVKISWRGFKRVLQRGGNAYGKDSRGQTIFHISGR